VKRSVHDHNASWARRTMVSCALGCALLVLCCTLISQSRPTVLLGHNAALDPDAPHARSSTSKMYMTQFDPDSPHSELRSSRDQGRPGKGLKLEYNMQNVLAHMSKGGQVRRRSDVPVRLYNPSSDPDSPSTRDHDQLSPRTKNMQARLSVETKMDAELKLKAQVAELSPKFMPTSPHDSMMLNLKSSRLTHITFHTDAAAKDDSKISKLLATATIAQESHKEVHALAREKEKAAKLDRRRVEEASWIKHNWAVNGAPKKPGFR